MDTTTPPTATAVQAPSAPGPAAATPEFWLRYDPKGCAVGSVRVSSVGLLPDDAHKEFTPRIADRRREAAEGWRHELADRTGFDAALPCLLGTCRHA